MDALRLTPRHNWYLLGLAVVLSVGGLALLYSAGQTTAGANSDYWQLQLIWLFVALTIYGALGFVPMRLVEKLSWAVYGASLLLLVAVLAFPSIGGARSWIRFGPLGFQPSEFAKIAAILLAARWVATLDGPPRSLRDLVAPAAILGAPALLTLAQPDIGTTTVFVALLAGIAFWAGTAPLLVFLPLSPLVSILLTFSLPLWSLYIVGVATLLFLSRPGIGTWLYVGGSNLLMGIVALPLWNSLAGYQRQRLLVFLQPEADPQGAGWNVIQSKVAIGSGGWLGKGFMEGTQKRLAFLPERHTDFIFSVLGEEFGFIGCAAVLLLFAILVQRMLKLAIRARSRFASILVVGIAASIVFHVAVNVSMTLGLAPVTGLPIPFLSYGGTFLLATMAQMGFLFNVAMRRNEV